MFEAWGPMRLVMQQQAHHSVGPARGRCSRVYSQLTLNTIAQVPRTPKYTHFVDVDDQPKCDGTHRWHIPGAPQQGVVTAVRAEGQGQPRGKGSQRMSDEAWDRTAPSPRGLLRGRGVFMSDCKGGY